jgi:UDP-hydrolysing UDP-N-acetyl-D-glucosamine 2-epimerase
MRKIAFHTGSRADYSPLSNVIKLLGDNAIHIQTEGLYGHEQYIKEQIERTRPDILVLLGDRYETLVVASVAALLCIPIAHIHGGEETVGAVDNGFRHAITKLSYWHMVAHADYAQRIIQMGEDPSRVFVTGAPGVDQYAHIKEKEHPIEPHIALVCYHPETLGHDKDNLRDIFALLPNYRKAVYISGANADSGGTEINEFWQRNKFQEWHFALTYQREQWIRLMCEADILIGNSSCFIIEGMTLGKRIINIGDRQKGRYEEALKHFAAERYPYGVPGVVSPKIAELLMTLPIPEKPRKAFRDLNY